MNNFTGILQVNARQGIKLVKIFSVTGISIKMQNCNENSTDVCLNGLCRGIYIVSITDDNLKTFSRKFVKN